MSDAPVASDRPALAKRHAPIPWLLDRFHLAIDALREILDEFIPIIEQREQERLGPAAMSEIRSLDPAQRIKLNEWLTKIIEAPLAGADGSGTENEVSAATLTAESDEEFGAVFSEIFAGDKHSIVAFADRMRKGTVGPDRVSIIHNSLLAQAVAAFEVLIAGVVTQHYIHHPGALDQEKAHFSLTDLRAFVDIDDAADALIAKHVSDVMYGGLDDWSSWLRRFCSFDLTTMVSDWQVVREVFQRRHIVIHNGGLVSRQYIANVKHAGEPPNVGDRLAVGSPYLRAALDELDVLGTTLAVLAWGTWHKDEREISATAVLVRTYDLLLRQRWSAVQQMALLGRRIECSEATRAALRCNGWCAATELRGPESIRDEVEQWDTSMAKGRFTLVKLVFLDRLDDAAELAPRLLQSGELQPGELREWPILRRLREHEGFDVSAATTAGTQGAHGIDRLELPNGPLT